MLIIFYAFIPMIISCQKINAEKVLRYALYISCLSIFYLKELFAFQYEGSNIVKTSEGAAVEDDDQFTPINAESY